MLSTRGHRWLLVFSALVLIAAAARIVTRWQSDDYNQALEGYSLYGAFAVADGKPLYPAPDQIPYHVYMVSPLHGWLAGTLLRQLGITDVHYRVRGVRALSFLAALIVLVFVIQLVRNEGVPWTILLLVLALGAYRLADYASTGRNDMLALLTELLVAWLYLAWCRRPRALLAIVLTLSVVVSVYTRQTGIVAAGAALLHLILQGRSRTAASFSLIWVALGLSGFALMQSWTGGHFFDHVIAANLRPVGGWKENFLASSTLLFFGLQSTFFYFGACGLRAIEWKETEGFLGICFVLSLCFGLVLLIRPGGDTNYLLEAIVFGSLFCARGIRNANLQQLAFPLSCVLLAIALVLGLKALPKQLPAYRSVAEHLLEDYPTPLFVGGSLGDSLIVHLQGRSLHGPSLTNHPAPVAEVAGSRFIFVYYRMYDRIRSGALPYAVLAEPGCSDPNLGEAVYPVRVHRVLREFRLSRVIAPGFCLYRYEPSAALGRLDYEKK